jgi:hypothetical protein
VFEMSTYKLSPAEKRLIREQSGLEPSAITLGRVALLAGLVALGTLLALHITILMVDSSGGILYARF